MKLLSKPVPRIVSTFVRLDPNMNREDNENSDNRSPPMYRCLRCQDIEFEKHMSRHQCLVRTINDFAMASNDIHISHRFSFGGR